MQNFKHPELGEIRGIEIDGEPWLVGKDVAAALGYSNASKAVLTHVDDEDKSFAMLGIADSQNGNMTVGQTKTAIINESGLYSLIFSSKLPNAKKVKSWIKRDILPILREHNSSDKNDDNTSESLVNAPDMDKKCAIQAFEEPEFGEIRILTEGEKTLFCAHDVATALGYKKPRNAIATHCRYALKRGVPHPQAPDKSIEILFIPEGDVYRLIVRSDLPSAEKFERWVFDEVLPSIRKTGMYVLNPTASPYDVGSLSPSLQMATTLLKNANILLETMVRTELEQKRQAEEQARQAAEQEQ